MSDVEILSTQIRLATPDGIVDVRRSPGGVGWMARREGQRRWSLGTIRWALAGALNLPDRPWPSWIDQAIELIHDAAEREANTQ